MGGSSSEFIEIIDWQTNGQYASDTYSPSYRRDSKTKELAVKRSKVLFFNNVVCAILIPTRKEYEIGGLKESLWWTSKDYDYFQLSFALEVKVMVSTCNIDTPTAVFRLCQPSCPLDIH